MIICDHKCYGVCTSNRTGIGGEDCPFNNTETCQFFENSIYNQIAWWYDTLKRSPPVGQGE